MLGRAHSNQPDSTEAERLGMGGQERCLQNMYPRPKAHPFPVRVPAFPEDEDRDQALYHLPHYRYPHTLTFMDMYTPEAEAEMITEFEAVHGKVDRPVTMLSASNSIIQDTGNCTEDCGTKGWSAFIIDKTTMGFGWAFQKIRSLGEKEVNVNEPPKLVMAEPAMPKPPKPKPVMSRPAIRSPGMPTPIMKRKDRVWCVRNGGGPKSFLPSNIYDNASDTEGEEDEELTAKYLGKDEGIKRPVETVFGKDVAVARSMGGHLHARIVDSDSWMYDASANGPGHVDYICLRDSSRPPVSRV